MSRAPVVNSDEFDANMDRLYQDYLKQMAKYANDKAHDKDASDTPEIQGQMQKFVDRIRAIEEEYKGKMDAHRTSAKEQYRALLESQKSKTFK
jgi:hypothetical protein